MKGDVPIYSPKIPDRYIPELFMLARARGLPMTRLVAEAVERLLDEQRPLLEDRRNRPEPAPVAGRPETGSLK